MIYSQKYTIVQFLEPIQDQQTFSMENWPLHITLADVFAVTLNQSLLDQLAAFVAEEQCFSVTAKGERRLGEEENPVTVTVLEKTAVLQSLHDKLIDLLQANGAVFNSPQFTRQGFLPHATHQKHARLEEQLVSINELSLVDMFVDGNWQQREVLKRFKLKS